MQRQVSGDDYYSEKPSKPGGPATNEGYVHVQYDVPNPVPDTPPPEYHAATTNNVSKRIEVTVATQDEEFEDSSGFKCTCMSVLKDLWAFKTTIFIFLTPLILLPLPIAIKTEAARAAYLLIWMAVWWITECVPIAVTSLLPVVILPLLGVMKPGAVSINYMRDAAMLFIGGLVVAIGIEKWNLHKRIAFRILLIVGSRPVWLMMGFMMVTWFLSMWISNTATTAMMLPVVSAVLDQLDPRKLADEKANADGQVDATAVEMTKKGAVSNGVAITDAGDKTTEATLEDEQAQEEWRNKYRELCKGMNLCICYAANIGGTATLTGTTPNLIMQGYISKMYEDRNLSSPLSFATWMGFGLPGALISVILCWLWLQFYFFGFKGSFIGALCNKENKEDAAAVKRVLRKEYEKLGPMSFAEIMILCHFVGLAILWLTRDPQFVPGWASLFKDKYVKDSTPAIVVTILLFVMPAYPPKLWCCRRPGQKRGPVEALMDWETIHEKFPWGVLLLLGGGFAIAEAAEVSLLSNWISSQLTALKVLPPWAMVMIICFAVTMITQVTSNTAITTLMLPILKGLSESVQIHPMYLMLSATISASCAFMLPVATPPNAIVFAYGHVKVIDMVKAGFMMNVLCVLVITLGINTWGTAMFNLSVMPWGTNQTTVAPPTPNTTENCTNLLYGGPLVTNSLWNTYIEEY